MQTLTALAIAATIAALLPAMASHWPSALPAPTNVCADGVEIVAASGVARIGCAAEVAGMGCTGVRAGDRVTLGETCQIEPDGMRASWMVLWDLPLDINRRSAAELARVPGLGPAMAERIVAHRTRHGAFARLEDLTQVHGLGRKTLQKLTPHLQAGAGRPR